MNKVKVIVLGNGKDERICRTRSEARRLAKMYPEKWENATLELKRIDESKL